MSWTPSRPVGELGIAEQQLVEIARALAFDARLIIMDEPTAPLSGAETSRLFRIISELRDCGVSIVYITHRLQEIFEVADRVTVLRDGRHVRDLCHSGDHRGGTGSRHDRWRGRTRSRRTDRAPRAGDACASRGSPGPANSTTSLST